MQIQHVHSILFDGGGCKLKSSWPPARVTWSWELWPLRHLVGIARNPGMNSVKFFVRMLRTREPLARNWKSNFEHKLIYVPVQTKASPMAVIWQSKAPRSGARLAQRHPTGSQGQPKESQGGAPTTPKGEQQITKL